MQLPEKIGRPLLLILALVSGISTRPLGLQTLLRWSSRHGLIRVLAQVPDLSSCWDAFSRGWPKTQGAVPFDRLCKPTVVGRTANSGVIVRIGAICCIEG